jgi:hypothetical protein
MSNIVTLSINKELLILKFVIVIILLTCVAAHYPNLHAYVIVLSTEYDGNIVIENEKNVVLFLENIIRDYGNYSIKAFRRKTISHTVYKTASTTHSFYVIYMADDTYHTLSFSATGKWVTSKGAWAMDTQSDIASYIDYLQKNNIWEVEEIITNNGINTLLTIRNVLSKIQNNTTYYFNSKINKNDNHDNCNTALFETLTEIL